VDIQSLAAEVRTHPGLIEKRGLAAVADGIGGDGDDAAVLDDGIVVCTEAVWPPFVQASPRVAGIAGVVTVLSDLAATGARPLAILDTVVAGDPDTAREVLAGVQAGAQRFGVPVVGGHTTVAPGHAGLTTTAVGRAVRPLRARNARPGDALVVVVITDGEEVPAPDGASFFSHLRGSRAGGAAADLALMADAAEAGDAWAARDISMPGIAGSLVQMCESAGRLGCALRVDALPIPASMDLRRWIITFPSYGFLIAGDPSALITRFMAARIPVAEVGRFDESGRVRLTDGTDEALVWDLSIEPLTGLSPPA